MPRGVPKQGSKYLSMFRVGQQFGRWTVVDSVPQKVSKNASILVRCDCGTERLVQCTNLLSGRSLGCECVIRGNKSFHWKGTDHISGRYLHTIKTSATKRKLLWDVTDEYLDELYVLQNYLCAVSGVGIVFSSKFDRQTASLDRVDSGLGYIRGNVQWVHKNINLMKNSFRQEEFLYWCKLVYDYNRNQFETIEFSESRRTQKLFRSSKYETHG